MIKEWIKDIPNWENEYLEMAKGTLSEQQKEILNGRDLKSTEGMIFGEMYSDWKRRKEL